VDTPANVQRVGDIVRTMDVNTFDRVHFKLYSLQNASVEDVGKELKEAFDATKLQQVLGGQLFLTSHLYPESIRFWWSVLS